MPEPCLPTVDACLEDPSLVACCSCEEAERLRCVLLARLKEISCGCMSSPVEMAGVRYASPVELMDAIRRLIELTYAVCRNSIELEGPVVETIWHDVCGSHKGPCDPCYYDETGLRRFWYKDYGDAQTDTPGETCQ